MIHRIPAKLKPNVVLAVVDSNPITLETITIAPTPIGIRIKDIGKSVSYPFFFLKNLYSSASPKPKIIVSPMATAITQGTSFYSVTIESSIDKNIFDYSSNFNFLYSVPYFEKEVGYICKSDKALANQNG